MSRRAVEQSLTERREWWRGYDVGVGRVPRPATAGAGLAYSHGFINGRADAAKLRGGKND